MKHLNHFFVKRLVLYSCGLVFVIWLLVGCTSSQESSETFSATATRTTEIPPSILPTATITIVTPTNTSVPTQTPLPSRTYTPLPPTLTPTLVPTSTPVPTLTYEGEGELLQELMATNGGCQLPCWWGIKLGDTLMSVGETFNQWGAAPWRVTTSGDEIGYINLGYYEPDTGFDSVRVFSQFYAVEGVVQYIEISGSHESRQFGEQEFVTDWEQYFLSSFLQTYGKPTLVYFVPGSIMEQTSTYTLHLYYPDSGINISYNFLGTPLSDNVLEVCFRLEDVFLVQLYLYNPKFAENWPIPHLLGRGSTYEPWLIENQLGIDLDTFYEIYQDPNNLGCIQVLR